MHAYLARRSALAKSLGLDRKPDVKAATKKTGAGSSTKKTAARG